MEEEFRFYGQLLDEQILSKILSVIREEGGDYRVISLDFGEDNTDRSSLHLSVTAGDEESLACIRGRLLLLGGEPVCPEEVSLLPAPATGVLPDAFYVTTNLSTMIFVEGRWIAVQGDEMDLVVVYDSAKKMAFSLPMAAVAAGQMVVVGEKGVKVALASQAGSEGRFSFMSSDVSAEKPKHLLLQKVVRLMRLMHSQQQKILVVAGPAVIHTGGGPFLERLIEQGWVDVLFAGNALATHDVEQALYSTSLGIPMASHHKAESHGHAHHLWAINAVRKAGSLAEAVSQGVLKKGIMHTCIMHSVPYVLAGSIRDDGPLPDVITDVIRAQQAMRKLLPGVGIVLMVGTTLHSIAVGNLLSGRVYTVCVDISPGVVTKLRDRGSRQAVGIVMDAASFFENLCRGLEGLEKGK